MRLIPIPIPFPSHGWSYSHSHGNPMGRMGSQSSPFPCTPLRGTRTSHEPCLALRRLGAILYKYNINGRLAAVTGVETLSPAAAAGYAVCNIVGYVGPMPSRECRQCCIHWYSARYLHLLSARGVNAYTTTRKIEIHTSTQMSERSLLGMFTFHSVTSWYELFATLKNVCHHTLCLL